MRLSPSVGGALPREVLPGGLIADGHFFPAGTVLAVPHYAIHHNPAYYPDPFAYKPERWLDANKGAVELAHSAFCPFSIGPRACIGKGMAYLELSVALARMVWLFDMRLKPGSRVGEGGWEGAEYGRHRAGEYQLMDKFTSWMDGPLVEFRRRLD
jgi:cytochrome P450